MSNDINNDLDKLKQALSSLSGKFSSVQDILESFGLASLPTAQRYGILFGICVFVFTITTVLMLLIYGGTFARIQQQSQGNAVVKEAQEVRKSRPLLLERLLEARDRMLAENYPPPPKRTKCTPLTEMLLNVNYNNTIALNDKNKKNGTRHEIPEGYEENYKKAYLTCQDKPGGTSLLYYILCTFLCCLLTRFSYYRIYNIFQERHCRVAPKHALKPTLVPMQVVVFTRRQTIVVPMLVSMKRLFANRWKQINTGKHTLNDVHKTSLDEPCYSKHWTIKHMVRLSTTLHVEMYIREIRPLIPTSCGPFVPVDPLKMPKP